MNYSGKELQLINKIYSLLQDNLCCLEAWGFYIFSEELKNEHELKNRLGIIWLSSLFDSVNAQEKLIIKYSKEATDLNLNHMIRYCKQANAFIESVKEILQKYTNAEQLFIQNLRNQWVHSHLSGRHSDFIRVKYIESNMIIDNNLTHEEYHETIRPLFEKGNLDITLKEFISRFMDRTDKYWILLSDIQKNHRMMYNAMLNGNEFEWEEICEH